VLYVDLAEGVAGGVQVKQSIAPAQNNRDRRPEVASGLDVAEVGRGLDPLAEPLGL
jgi:hypothetical protein